VAEDWFMSYLRTSTTKQGAFWLGLEAPRKLIFLGLLVGLVYANHEELQSVCAFMVRTCMLGGPVLIGSLPPFDQRRGRGYLDSHNAERVEPSGNRAWKPRKAWQRMSAKYSQQSQIVAAQRTIFSGQRRTPGIGS
jgi:hypothetical protein